MTDDCIDPTPRPDGRLVRMRLVGLDRMVCDECGIGWDIPEHGKFEVFRAGAQHWSAEHGEPSWPRRPDER